MRSFACVSMRRSRSSAAESPGLPGLLILSAAAAPLSSLLPLRRNLPRRLRSQLSICLIFSRSCEIRASFSFASRIFSGFSLRPSCLLQSLASSRRAFSALVPSTALTRARAQSPQTFLRRPGPLVDSAIARQPRATAASAAAFSASSRSPSRSLRRRSCRRSSARLGLACAPRGAPPRAQALVRNLNLRRLRGVPRGRRGPRSR